MAGIGDRTSLEYQVELRKATKLYGSFAAIADIDLGIRPGEFFSILGPSGGGKTTVLRSIAGLIELTSGDLLIEGAPVRGVPVYKRGVGIVFQNYALFPHMNVFDNIAFGLRMRKLGREEVRARVLEAMARVRLEGFEERRSSQLSGGQQQRVALARAIVINPKVLLLDEPLGALDRNLRIAMQAELKALQRDLAVTTICVTHDQEEALSLSDRIALLNNGRLEQVGTPYEIYEQPANRFAAEFVGGTNILTGTAANGAGGSLEVVLRDGTRVRSASEAQVAEGDNSMLSVRYEKIALSRNKPKGSDLNMLSGTITNVAYSGSGSVVHVRIDDELSLIATCPGRPPYEQGESVFVSWGNKDAVLLPLEGGAIQSIPTA